MCCTGICKCILGAANTIILFAGLGILIVGVLYYYDISEITSVIPYEYRSVDSAPITLMAIGGVIVVIAFLGCAGSIYESSCLLLSYAILLLIIFVVQTVLAILILITIKEETIFKRHLSVTLNKSFGDYDENAAKKEWVDTTQKNFKCCGVGSKEYWEIKNQTVPDSCKDSSGNYYPDGCLHVIYERIKDDLNTMGIVLMCLGLSEILGIALACCELLNVREKARRQSRAGHLSRFREAEQRHQEELATQQASAGEKNRNV